jgi:hypothetical protein
MSSVPLKLKDSADFQNFTSTEENYLAYQVGLSLAEMDSSSPAALSLYGTNSATSIVGYLTNTAYDSAVGTGGDGSFLTFSTTNTILRQTTGTVAIADSDYRLPLIQRDSDGKRVIREMNDSDTSVLLERLNSRIFTSDYVGTYRMGSSAPSGDYSVYLNDVMTDTRSDGHSLQYNIYQRTNQTSPTQVLPFSIKRSNGDGGDYQGLQLMTPRQIKYSLGLKSKNKIASNTDGIGAYRVYSSATGTPTNVGLSGTWVAKGTATDTRQAIVDANYTRGRVSTYSRLREVNFTDTYARTRSSAYSADYTTTRSSAYTANYVTTRTSNYSLGFVGNYIGDFTRNREEDFTRTRSSTFDYVGNYVGDFTGNYSRLLEFAGNYGGNYVGTAYYTSRTRGPSYNGGDVDLTNYWHVDENDGTAIAVWDDETKATGATTDTSLAGTDGYIYNRGARNVIFGNETFKFYELNRTRSAQVDYTRTSTRTSTRVSTYTRISTQDFLGNYTRTLNYLGNYTGDFLGEYTSDFTRTTPDDFTRDFIGDYAGEFTRTRASTYTRARSSTYTGNYLGNFAGDFLGNFTGNYVGLGSTTSPTVLTQHGKNLAQYEAASPGNGAFSGWDTVFTMSGVPSGFTLTTGNIQGNAYQDRGSGSWGGTLYLRAVDVSTGVELQRRTVTVNASTQSFLRAPGALKSLGSFSFTTPASGSIRFEAGCQTNHGHSSCIEVFTATVGGYDYTSDSTRTSLRTSTRTSTREGSLTYLGNYVGSAEVDYTRTATNFLGNYSRNFLGDYSTDFSRTRTSTYLGSDTFSRNFEGNYLGNYTRNFTRSFEGNYSRNFAGEYVGDYTQGYIGDYARTFTGNYAGSTIGSGNTTIETYTLYVRIA